MLSGSVSTWSASLSAARGCVAAPSAGASPCGVAEDFFAGAATGGARERDAGARVGAKAGHTDRAEDGERAGHTAPPTSD